MDIQLAQLVNDVEGNLCNVKLTYNSGEVLYVPLDNANRHYQEYLEWVADGGVPEEADTPEEAE